MGKGQPVVSVYMGMSSGRPQPMTVMKVGVGSERRSSGVMDEASVRRYSWQFYRVSVSAMHGVWVGWGWVV
jgi:hypothetical protein